MRGRRTLSLLTPKNPLNTAYGMIRVLFTYYPGEHPSVFQEGRFFVGLASVFGLLIVFNFYIWGIRGVR